MENRPGPKNIFGFGAGCSRLPVLKKKRQAVEQNRFVSRSNVVNRNRNLEIDVNDRPHRQQDAVVTEKIDRQSRLQVYKEQRARERLEEIRKKMKPFYAGGSVSRSTSRVGDNRTPNGAPLPSTKRPMPTGSAVTIFGLQKTKPDVPRPIHNLLAPMGLPPRPPQTQVPVQRTKFEKTPTVTIKEALKFLPGATSTPRASEVNAEDNAPWYAGMDTAFTFDLNVEQTETSSDGGIRSGLISPKNTSNSSNDDEKNDAFVNDQKTASAKKIGSESSQSPLAAGVEPPVQHDSVDAEVVPSVVPKNASDDHDFPPTPGSLRRSMRTTRFTGPFFSAFPRRGESSSQAEPSVAPKSIPAPWNILDELSGPGIMEEEMPDFLVPSSACDTELAIGDTLATLSLSTTIPGSDRHSVSTWTSLGKSTNIDLDISSLSTAGHSTGSRMSTWTSIELSRDEDDTVFLTPPTSGSSTTPGTAASNLNETFTVDEAPSPPPSTVNKPPDTVFRTPGSILRKPAAASTHKKAVRFPEKFPSPIQFEVPSPNATPPDQIVNMFSSRRPSAMNKGEIEEEMMKF